VEPTADVEAVKADFVEVGVRRLHVRRCSKKRRWGAVSKSNVQGKENAGREMSWVRED